MFSSQRKYDILTDKLCFAAVLQGFSGQSKTEAEALIFELSLSFKDHQVLWKRTILPKTLEKKGNELESRLMSPLRHFKKIELHFSRAINKNKEAKAIWHKPQTYVLY